MSSSIGKKKSLFYRLLVAFIFLIIIPILSCWLIYEKVLSNYYRENILTARQVNMENSLSLLDSSLDAVNNAFVAIGGNQEVIYYLDYRSGKSNMPYGTLNRIKYLCKELNTMTPYLNSLKIYSDSPLVIYASPLVKLEKFQQEDIMNALETVDFKENIWQVAPVENEDFPSIYGYRKLYTETYLRGIGYMEVQLSSDLLKDYFDLLSELIGDSRAVLTLYHGNREIYSTSPEEMENILVEGKESGYEIMLSQNQYRNYLRIPELNLYVVCSGYLSDLNIMPSQNIPSLFISVIILLLMVLFLIFFMIIVSLSKRIVAFSTFIRNSDSDNLLPFQPGKKPVQRKDELDSLIETYNSLIKRNNTLISKIEKMELFTQAARFQALQEQIHPHFIYGTLETIRMTALQNKDTEAASMIFSLSTLLRYSMAISTKAVTLKDELEIARHYLEIQKMRFDNRIKYVFRVDEKLLDMEMPSFVLQPILENAIVYGVAQTLEPCTLTVEACEEDNCIILSISNTGLPITEKRLQEVNQLLSGSVLVEMFKGKRNGLALNNIKERIAIFYGGRASIQLALHEGRTATVITIEKIIVTIQDTP